MNKAELAENLTYDNRNVISGYPLRYNGLRAVQGELSSFTESLQSLTFELSPINWYANKTSLNMAIRVPATANTDSINCLLKILPVDRIRISTRSSKTAIEIPHVFRMACMKYFKKRGERPGDVYSFGTIPEFVNGPQTADPVANPNLNYKTFYFSWNLGDYLQAFFNTRNVIPLTEVTQIEFTFLSKDLIAYNYTKLPGGADASLSSTNYAASIFNKGYVTASLSGAVIAPVNSALAAANAEQISSIVGQIFIDHCALVYEQERNPIVDLALKDAVHQGKMMALPYINCVPSSQTFANLSNSYTMSLRLTNTVGNKLKRIVFTTGLADDKKCLKKLGTYNSSNFGAANITNLFFDIGGRNIASYNVKQYDHLNTKEYDFGLDNQIDRVLEDTSVSNVLVAGGAANDALNINAGRFRAIPKNCFMIDLPFETVTDDEAYSSNSGVDLNGDEVLNIRMELDKELEAGLGGVRMTCFLYGIKFMKIEPNLMDFI